MQNRLKGKGIKAAKMLFILVIKEKTMSCIAHNIFWRKEEVLVLLQYLLYTGAQIAGLYIVVVALGRARVLQSYEQDGTDDLSYLKAQWEPASHLEGCLC